MLKITRETKENSVYMALNGRLDSLTSPDFEKELVSVTESDVTSVTLDFAELEYVSSAGLRVLLNLQQTMEDKGELKILHVNENIMEIFEITGFTDILKIE